MKKNNNEIINNIFVNNYIILYKLISYITKISLYDLERYASIKLNEKIIKNNVYSYYTIYLSIFNDKNYIITVHSKMDYQKSIYIIILNNYFGKNYLTDYMFRDKYGKKYINNIIIYEVNLKQCYIKEKTSKSNENLIAIGSFLYYPFNYKKNYVLLKNILNNKEIKVLNGHLKNDKNNSYHLNY